MLHYLLFLTSDVFSFRRHIFHLIEDPGVVQIELNISNSLFYQKLVKIAFLDKR